MLQKNIIKPDYYAEQCEIVLTILHYYLFTKEKKEMDFILYEVILGANFYNHCTCNIESAVLKQSNKTCFVSLRFSIL